MHERSPRGLEAPGRIGSPTVRASASPTPEHRQSVRAAEQGESLTTPDHMPSEYLERIDVGTDRRFVGWRRWGDNALVDAGTSEPGNADSLPVVTVHWVDAIAMREYWCNDGPIGAVTLVGSRLPAAHICQDWFEERFPAQPIPGLTMHGQLRCTGLSLNPSAYVALDARLVDGQTAGEDAGEKSQPELIVTGHARDLMSWCTNRRMFRDLAGSFKVEGDGIFFLGALAGAIGINGGFHFDRDLLESLDLALSLVEDHRAMVEDFGSPPEATELQ